MKSRKTGKPQIFNQAVPDICTCLKLSLCELQKICLKTYDAPIHCMEKTRNFAIQAINTENGQKIGRKYNGNIAGDFLRKTPL